MKTQSKAYITKLIVFRMLQRPWPWS